MSLDGMERFLEECEKPYMKREGLKDLLAYLRSGDFFTAPASTMFHGAYEGGLVDHSIAVYDVAMDKNASLQVLGEDYWESIAICALFHDVCKDSFYEADDEDATEAQIKYMLDLCSKKDLTPPPRNNRTKSYISKVISALKDGQDMPEFRPMYKVNDRLPFGHGEKSVYIINKFMLLTDEEALAIRWHLGGHDTATHFSYPSGLPFRQAFKQHPLVPLIASADFDATYMVDKW